MSKKFLRRLAWSVPLVAAGVGVMYLESQQQPTPGPMFVVAVGLIIVGVLVLLDPTLDQHIGDGS